ALVQLEHLEGAGLTARAEVRIERNVIQRAEREHQLLDLACGGQEADLRAAETGDHGQILQVGARNGARQSHRLAAGRPATKANGHSIGKFGDDVVNRHALVEHALSHPSHVPTYDPSRSPQGWWWEPKC